MNKKVDIEKEFYESRSHLLRTKSEGSNKEKDKAENKEKDEMKIRVLIMTNDYQGYYHDEVALSNNGNQSIYTSNDIDKGMVSFTAEENGIQIMNLYRGEGNPIYYGKIELYPSEQGILVINELPVEEYLKAVVPSEMPDNYHLEALKAQAVCARTYAWKQIYHNKLEEYHAHVDDSVNFQVYNNIFPKKNTTRAVEETKGMVISQNGELIDAYYFSTSSGWTNTNEVWGSVEAASYLRSVKCDYDADATWSNWTSFLTWTELCMNMRKEGLPCEQADSVEFIRKAQSGAIIELRVYTDAGEFNISGEYNVRKILSSSNGEVKNAENRIVNMNLLPSAVFTLKQKEDGIYITGKGYGHGVGMSQNGANEMAKLGYTCEEILNYFYNNIELTHLDKGFLS